LRKRVNAEIESLRRSPRFTTLQRKKLEVFFNKVALKGVLELLLAFFL
jgi:hypothetical protein